MTPDSGPTTKIKLRQAAFWRRLDQMGITVELTPDQEDMKLDGATTGLQEKHIEWMRSHKAELLSDLKERAAALSALYLLIDNALVWKDLEDIIARSLDLYSTGCLSRGDVEKIAIACSTRSKSIPCSWDNVSLKRLADAHGRKLMINSRLLEETICLTSDADAPPKDNQGRIVYTAAELAHINGISADKLRSIHSVKRQFDAEIISTTDEPLPESQKEAAK